MSAGGLVPSDRRVSVHRGMLVSHLSRDLDHGRCHTAPAGGEEASSRAIRGDAAGTARVSDQPNEGEAMSDTDNAELEDDPGLDALDALEASDESKSMALEQITAMRSSGIRAMAMIDSSDTRRAHKTLALVVDLLDDAAAVIEESR